MVLVLDLCPPTNINWNYVWNGKRLMVTNKEMNDLKRKIEISSLEFFMRQAKEVILIPVGTKTDDIYYDFLEIVKKADKRLKRLK